MGMLRAHSFLWHYLWVAPNVILLFLALLIWRRGHSKHFPAFFAFAFFSAVAELAVYTADVAPWVSAKNFWLVDWASLLIEGPLKFVLIGEIFAQAFGAYPSLAKSSRFLIRTTGIVLVFAASLAAAYVPASSRFGIISGAHVLDQTIYLIETGLLAFIFLFSAYYRLKLVQPTLGITLGLGISSCVHLASWALIASGRFSNETRYYFDFLNMGTYHVCVLIWFYYLLVPQEVAVKSAVPLPENNLAVWNRELERLLQQ